MRNGNGGIQTGSNCVLVQQSNEQTMKRKHKVYCGCCPALCGSIVLMIGICISLIDFVFSSLVAHAIGIIVSLISLILFLTLLYELFQNKTRVNGKYMCAGHVIAGILIPIILILLLVRVNTNAMCEGSIPNKCIHAGCTKISYNNPQRGNNRPPLNIHTKTEQVKSVAKSWLENQPRTNIVEETDTFLHAQTMSFLWGFVDDTCVQFHCNSKNRTVSVEMYAELRFGEGDFDVNDKRIMGLLDALHVSTFSDDDCT